MSNASEAIARQIVESTAKCGITTIASLPDGWITDLITAYARDNRFRHLAVNREEAAIGFCSGCLSRRHPRSMALMGASGLPDVHLCTDQDQLHLPDPDPDRDHAARTPRRWREVSPVQRALSRIQSSSDRHAVHSDRKRAKTFPRSASPMLTAAQCRGRSWSASRANCCGGTHDALRRLLQAPARAPEGQR